MRHTMSQAKEIIYQPAWTVERAGQVRLTQRQRAVRHPSHTVVHGSSHGNAGCAEALGLQRLARVRGKTCGVVNISGRQHDHFHGFQGIPLTQIKERKSRIGCTNIHDQAISGAHGPISLTQG